MQEINPSANAANPDPTPEDRQSLIRAYQAQALQRPDPLAANLGMLMADLLRMALRLSANLDELAKPPDSSGAGRYCQHAETYLKVVRQIDRFAQLERRPVSPSGGERQ